MKKISAVFMIISLCCLFLTACGGKKELNTLEKIAEKGILTAGVREDAGVFGYIDEKGAHAGFDIDTARIIAEKITGSPDKVQFITVSAASRIEAVSQGAADIVIASMSYTPERENYVDFSIPYYTAGQTAAVRKDSGIYAFADLNDKTVVIAAGSTAKKNLKLAAPGAKIISFGSNKEAFDALKAGKGDAVCADEDAISGFVHKNKDFRALNNKISAEYYVIAMQKTKDKALKNKIDSIINEMYQNGSLKALKYKWKLL